MRSLGSSTSGLGPSDVGLACRLSTRIMGVAVGYDHTIDYIKNQGYTPQLYGDVESELMQIRPRICQGHHG